MNNSLVYNANKALLDITWDVKHDLKEAFHDKKCQKILLISCSIIFILSLALTIACCASASASIESGVKIGTEKIYDILTKIVAPIAVIVIGWSALKILFLGERDVENAKKKILITIIVIAAVWFAPVIVVEVQNWFNTAGKASVFKYN